MKKIDDELIHKISSSDEAAFSSDGKTLADGSGDRPNRFRKAHTGTLKHTFTGHSESVMSVAFSHDGNIIAVGLLMEVFACGMRTQGNTSKRLIGLTIWSIACNSRPMEKPSLVEPTMAFAYGIYTKVKTRKYFISMIPITQFSEHSVQMVIH